jgi:hypothetical protein
MLVHAGRPLIMRNYKNIADGILYCWYLGIMSSKAIVNTLFGYNNPSAKLTMSFPYCEGQIPVYYNNLPTGRPNDINKPNEKYFSKYIDIPNEPLYKFGYGLSYSKFEYSNYSYELLNDKLVVTLDVKNTSDIDGYDVIEVYVGKENSNIYRPIKELKGFSKVFVKARKTVKCVVEVNVKDLTSYRNETDSFEIEEGQYEVYVALNTKDILDKHIINLEGVTFDVCKEVAKLIKKEIPSDYSFDSPAGLLLENELFKKYVTLNKLNIDVSDFEHRYFYIDSKAMRVTICDGDFDITFEQMEEMIKYLNENPHHLTDRINFDELVKKYRPW